MSVHAKVMCPRNYQDAPQLAIQEVDLSEHPIGHGAVIRNLGPSGIYAKERHARVSQIPMNELESWPLSQPPHRFEEADVEKMIEEVIRELGAGALVVVSHPRAGRLEISTIPESEVEAKDTPDQADVPVAGQRLAQAITAALDGNLLEAKVKEGWYSDTTP